MAAPNNLITTSDMNVALDREFILNFEGDYDRLAEILGIFAPERMAAGTALYQLKVTGTLNNDKDDNGSSGSSYVEGDLVNLSKYTATKEPIGAIAPKPYRKATSGANILKNGYEIAVMKTDQKMQSHIRADIIKEFFAFMAKGTGEAAGTGLQEAAAMVDAKLGDTMETNGDEGGKVIHFINRTDAAKYIGAAPITTQTMFGMTYLQNFLGMTDVFLTNKVASGTMYATPAENIHIFTVDFGELARADLSYQQSDSGLIGVAHTPAYDHVSTETNVLTGMLLFPEVKDYIVKGTINPAAA